MCPYRGRAIIYFLFNCIELLATLGHSFACWHASSRFSFARAFVFREPRPRSATGSVGSISSCVFHARVCGVHKNFKRTLNIPIRFDSRLEGLFSHETLWLHTSSRCSQLDSGWTLCDGIGWSSFRTFIVLVCLKHTSISPVPTEFRRQILIPKYLTRGKFVKWWNFGGPYHLYTKIIIYGKCSPQNSNTHHELSLRGLRKLSAAENFPNPNSCRADQLLMKILSTSASLAFRHRGRLSPRFDRFLPDWARPTDNTYFHSFAQRFKGALLNGERSKLCRRELTVTDFFIFVHD